MMQGKHLWLLSWQLWGRAAELEAEAGSCVVQCTDPPDEPTT